MLVRGISACNTGKNNETSFGWGHNVHETVSVELCKKYNKGLKSGFLDIGIIRHASSHPDSYIPKKLHFANIHRFSSGNKTADAFTMVQSCYKDALKEHMAGNHVRRDKFFGSLIHFLQDSLSLVHATRFRVIPDKNNPEIQFHIDYENIADGKVAEIVRQMQGNRPVRAYGDFFAQLQSAMQRTQNSLTELVRASGYPSGTSIQELPDEAVDKIFRKLSSSQKPKDMIKVLKRTMDDSLRNTYEMTELFLAHVVEELNGQGVERIAAK